MINGLINWLDRQQEYALLILRVLTGVILFKAGYAKVFGYGMGAVTDSFRSMGILLPEVAGPFVALLELVGGAGLVVGLFTRYLGVLFTVQFIVALLAVNIGKGFDAGRLDMFLIVAAILFATRGAGRMSLDNMLGRKR